MKLLTDEDKKVIAEAVGKAEAQTSGEIVFAVADASARYHHELLKASIVGMAAAAAIYLALPFDHTMGILLWTQIVSFALFYAILPHLPIRRLVIPSREMEARVGEAAFLEFYSSGLYRTRESNGVLIYLSVFERRVVVIGDRGIHEKMGNQHWDDLRDLIIDGIRRGNPSEGICAAVEACGRALASHFPHQADDVNELPDQVIDRTVRPDAP
jgi:putative membrane protein